MVMAAHLPFSGAGLGGSGSPTSYPPQAIADVMAHGHFGVQLFLVISGYCIHARWARQPYRDARVAFFPFWRRRLTRLYPPFVVVVALSVGLTIFASRFAPGAGPSWSAKQLAFDIVILLLFLQNMTDAGGRVGNPPFWSLGLEEQLYLLYFPLLALRRKHGWRSTLAIVTGINLLWLLGTLFIPDSWQFGWRRAGPAYWLPWTLGAIAAESHYGVIETPKWTQSFVTFAVTLVVGAFLPPTAQFLAVTCSFFFLLHAAVTAEKRRPNLFEGPWFRPFIFLWSISYGVYLIHNIAFVVSKRLIVAWAPLNVVLVLRLSAGIAAGYVIYLLVEQPFLRLSKQIRVPILRGDAPRA